VKEKGDKNRVLQAMSECLEQEQAGEVLAGRKVLWCCEFGEIECIDVLV